MSFSSLTENPLARFVFLNDLNILRAGWRIAVFLLIAFSAFRFLSVVLESFDVLSQLGVGVLLYGCVGLATVVNLQFIDKRPYKSVGLSLQKRTVVEIAQGAGMGFTLVGGLFVVQYALGYVEPTLMSPNIYYVVRSFVASLLFFAVFAFGEELMFRGYAFQTLIEGTNPRTAIIVMSIFFGGAHLANPSLGLLSIPNAIFAGLNVLLAGVWFSIAYLKTKSLWFPAALHISWNFSEGFLFSFPVSGITYGDRSLLQLEQSGPGWVTGGPFGPEGGILATVAIVGSIIFILKSSHIRVGEGAWNRQEFFLSSLLPKNGSRKKV
ncbi:MAG: type II CAAX endopeptidase family protein [Bacteroidota bacterium]